MQYDLTKKEAKLLERYRALTEDFQRAADAQIKTLWELQTKIIKELISEEK